MKYMNQYKIAEKISGRVPWGDEDKKLRPEDQAYQDATINDAPPQKARRDSAGKLPSIKHLRGKEANRREEQQVSGQGRQVLGNTRHTKK